MISKDIIKSNFSKYARYYDKYATVQNFCALKLIKKIENCHFNKVLDIGCGTGNYTGLLKDRFPVAHIKALDISEEMVRIAKEKLKSDRIEFIIADGETIDLKQEFDLISSNVSLQWFEDIRGTLTKYKKLLIKDGIISFSIFGHLTFYELNKSLKEISGKDASVSSSEFIEKEKIHKIMKELFREIAIDEYMYKEKHPSLLELLKKIKYTGTRGNGINKNGFWTPRMMHELEKIYKKKFENITATYQILLCKGIK